MSIRFLPIVGAAALSLLSCVTAPPPLTADDLLSAPYSSSSGAPFDVNEFFAALPDWLSVTHAGGTFDDSIGAMVVDDVVFQIGSATGYRIRADRATIWEPDIDALNAVFDGRADLSTMSHLLDRIAFENISIDGVQWAGGQQSLAISVDQFVLDGLSARSFALTPKAGVPDGVSLIRTIAAIANAYAFEGVAYSNFSFQANDNQGAAVKIEIARDFVRGYEAGKTEYQKMSGIRTLSSNGGGVGENALVNVAEILSGVGQDDPQSKILQPHVRAAMQEALKNPVALLASAGLGMSSARETDSVEIRNVDISGALSWLARWELPPITETDLIDLGSWTILGDRETWNGKQVYSIDRADIKALDFYWLVPSKISYADTGVSIDTINFLDAFPVMVGGAVPPEMQTSLTTMREAITALGLERMMMSSTAHWSWDGEGGDAAYDSAVNIVGFADISAAFEIGGPSLVAWDGLMRSGENVNSADLLTFKSFRYAITDYAMLDRIFDYAASQAGGTGEELRQAMPTTIRALGADAEQLNPRISTYVSSFADFIAAGGTLEINARPVDPITFTALQETYLNAPETLPDVLELEVTHKE